MPSYKTHAIYTEEVIKEVKVPIELDIEELKCFSMGPDVLSITDNELFEYEHANKVEEYFLSYMYLIINNHLLDDPQVISKFIGMYMHLVLDAITHWYIYYMTLGLKSDCIFDPHMTFEMIIDDYLSIIYNKTDPNYFKKRIIFKKNLKRIINELYTKVFHRDNVSKKYEIGIFTFQQFDKRIKMRKNPLIQFISKIFKVGDVSFHNDLKTIEPLLNNNHETIYHPITGQPSNESFDDLWKKAIEIGQESLEGVINHLYNGAPNNSYFVNNDVSYNTGKSCKKRVKMRFYKKYNKKNNLE